MLNKIKNGFTLAEVLITLVIIGVVAALTISAVINTYVERSTISKVKKGLSTLAQAKKLAEAQNGSIVGWDFGEGSTAQTASDFWQYIKPHLAVVKDCGSGTSCYHSNVLFHLNGDLDTTNHNLHNRYYKFILADGGVMWYRMADHGKCNRTESGYNNVCAVFFYDVNGVKAPNTIGRDVFLYVMNVDGVYPYNESNQFNDCELNKSGRNCSMYIIKNDNMNYLH